MVDAAGSHPNRPSSPPLGGVSDDFQQAGHDQVGQIAEGLSAVGGAVRDQGQGDSIPQDRQSVTAATTIQRAFRSHLSKVRLSKTAIHCSPDDAKVSFKDQSLTVERVFCDSNNGDVLTVLIPGQGDEDPTIKPLSLYETEVGAPTTQTLKPLRTDDQVDSGKGQLLSVIGKGWMDESIGVTDRFSDISIDLGGKDSSINDFVKEQFVDQFLKEKEGDPDSLARLVYQNLQRHDYTDNSDELLVRAVWDWQELKNIDVGATHFRMDLFN